MTDKADLGVMYDADMLRYDPDSVKKANLTKEHVIAHYALCPSIGFEMDGVAFGGAVFDGKQVHLAISPEFQGRWALLLKPALKWLFALQDPVNVRVEIFNEKCLRFMDRNNWKRVGEDARYVTFEVTNRANHVINRRALKKSSSSTD